MNTVTGKVCGVGLLGFGIVGTGTWKVLENQREKIRNAAGTEITIRKILVRDKQKKRGIAGAEMLFTDQFEDLLNDEDIHILVDVMGGEEPALSYILAALKKGKHLVTANKEVMAKHGRTIYETAAANGCRIYTEACVAGGIPLLYPLQECFYGSQILRVEGIINGTTNYILTKMSEEQKGYTEALAEAQAQGYAEADPSADVEGRDALYKVILLARQAYGVEVNWNDVPCQGITQITALDMATADQWGYCIRLVGSVIKKNEGVCAQVRPVMIPKEHLLAAVRGVNNGVIVTGDAMGEILLAGPGAGQMPTGTAVVNDLVHATRAIVQQTAHPAGAAEAVRLLDSDKKTFYLRWRSAESDPESELSLRVNRMGARVESIQGVAEKDGTRVMQAVIHGLTFREIGDLTRKWMEENSLRSPVVAIQMGL